MLSPNALRILDTLDIYQIIKSQGFEFENVVYKDAENNTMDSYNMGSGSAFGYKALRIYRQTLLQELRNAATGRGISIVYGRKFAKVITETEESVTFEFEDGSQENATFLIGTDGIYSQVRKYLHPEVKPIYSGIMAITAAVSRSKLRFPSQENGEEYPLPVSIHGAHGAWVMAPQNPDGSEILVGRQNRHAELDKEGWKNLKNDKASLLSMLTADQTSCPDLVQSAMQNIIVDKLSIWPFYVVPRLSTWYSSKKRVIIVGDAAHAIPPTSGQGACQAFEDVYSFAFLFSKLPKDSKLGDFFETWLKYRHERIEQILDLTKKLNNRRLPTKQLEKLSTEEWSFDGSEEGQRWLFDPKIEEHVDALLR